METRTRKDTIYEIPSSGTTEKSACPNTFKIAPDKEGTFRAHIARPILDAVLKANLENYKYDSKTSNELCKRIADETKMKVRALGYARYKIVCQSLIFLDIGQSVKFASRYLWDDKVDNFVSSHYKGSNFVAVVSVGAVYFE